MSARFIPPVSPLTEPYWEATKRDELRVQKCGSCEHRPFPPRSHCERCGSEDLSWQTVSGAGTIYTYTIAARAPHPVFKDQCPLVIAVVELEEGPRMISNVVGCDPDEVRIGLPVRVAFEPIEDSDLKLPVFEPNPEPTAEPPGG